MPQNVYFSQINQALQKYKRAIPCLLIDLDRLDQNIETLKKSIRPEANFRVVVKSLPSIELLNYVMQKTQSKHLMVFHQPFLSDLSHQLDSTIDLLFGKPMPIKTTNFYYDSVKKNPQFNPFTQVQWLIDTKKRLKQYLDLANKLGQKLRVNLEIDVGLHRGGFTNLESLKEALELIKVNGNRLELSGLMGYEPHIVKLPKILRSQGKALQMANDFYKECKALIQNDSPKLWQNNLTFNGAGSPTLVLHNTKDSPINDVSAGSCLVKPTTFDIPTLESYLPATFIATPILKKFEGTTLPAIERFSGVLNKINASNQKSYFIYGGLWKADYYHPKGLKANALFGPSTNQTMLNAPAKNPLEVDDFIFLRPHQSEFVFLQFGQILAYRKGEIVAEWSLLKQY